MKFILLIKLMLLNVINIYEQHKFLSQDIDFGGNLKAWFLWFSMVKQAKYTLHTRTIKHRVAFS